MAQRTVLDTGVFGAALALRGRGSMAIVEAWLSDEFLLITSEPMLAELRDVLRDVFDLPSEEIGQWESRIRTLAEIVAPRDSITDCRDPGDNMVLEAAVAGHAQYIVTFDDDLWKLSPYRGIQILTVRDFLHETRLRPRKRPTR